VIRARRLFGDACVTSFALAALFAVSARLDAQAWVPPAHVGSVSLGFQWIDNTGHLLTDGVRDTHFPGKSVDASLALAVDYAFSDRLSLEIGIPFVWAKYIGPGPTPGPIFAAVDSCYCWNGGFQDIGLIARYNAIGEIGGAFQLTPSVAAGAPSRNYAYQGEAVVGRNLKEVALALDIGQRLDFLTPRLSVQGHYSYAFVERVLDIPNNRSNFALETDYQLTRTLTLRGLAAWQWTHGGLRAGGPTLPDLPPPGDINTDDRFLQHDRLLRNDYVHAGAGVSYQFPQLDVYANYIGFVNGTDTHAGWAVSVGVSWPFEIGGGSAAP
jgi:hypothetical protein